MKLQEAVMRWWMATWMLCSMACAKPGPVTVPENLAQCVERGAVAIVPAEVWVEVKNLRPMINADGNVFDFRERCVVLPGGSVTAVDVGGEGAACGHVLVEYVFDGPATGNLCPLGTWYYVSTETFHTMTAEYVRLRGQ